MRAIAALLCVALLAGPLAVAQQADGVRVAEATVQQLDKLVLPPGEISGRVLFIGGAPVKNAKVYITNAEGEQVAEATTDATGSFTVDLPAGDYTVTTSMRGTLDLQVAPGAAPLPFILYVDGSSGTMLGARTTQVAAITGGAILLTITGFVIANNVGGGGGDGGGGGGGGGGSTAGATSTTLAVTPAGP